MGAGKGEKEGAWRTGRSLRSSAGSSAAAGRGDLDGAACAALHGKASRFASDNGAATESSSLPFARVILPLRPLPTRTFHREGPHDTERSRVGYRIITRLHSAIVGTIYKINWRKERKREREIAIRTQISIASRSYQVASLQLARSVTHRNAAMKESRDHLYERL